MGIRVTTKSGRTYTARQTSETTWVVTATDGGVSVVVGSVERATVPAPTYTGTGTMMAVEWNGQDTLWRAVRDIARAGGDDSPVTSVDRDDVVTEATERHIATEGEASDVVHAQGRTFDVAPCGVREWTVTERGGNGASGLITDQGPRFEYAVDLSGVEGWANNGLASAVREFAAETRMVHATRAQRNVAAGYASPGAIGRVLAQLATTGTARLDLLSDDVRRTIGSLAMPERPAAAVALHGLLSDLR